MSTHLPAHQQEEVPVLDLRKPFTMYQGDNKVTVYDQNGHLYDGLTQMPLEAKDKDKYAIPEGAPFSKVKTTHEKIQDAINTIRASGAVDPDSLSNFDRMFRSMLADQGGTGAKGGGTSPSTTKPKE